MQSDSYFSFTGIRSDISGGNVSFDYEVFGNGQHYTFTDVLEFDPTAITSNARHNSEELDTVLRQLHLALGISYWKTLCPREIRMPSYQLSQYQAQFWNTVYTKGLGEFFYKNSIDYRGLIQFPFSQSVAVTSLHSTGRNRALVLLGGGKDSIVSGELLKKSEKQFSLFAVNPGKIHIKTAEIMEKELLFVTRKIDPKLFELNKQPGIYNGHIPISSIFAFLGVFVAFLYDYSHVVASNEEGASYGNVVYLGEEINHQWSKSLEFEELFRNYCKEFVTGGIEYYSFLRSKSELEIAKIFSGYPQYFQYFTSCNKAFRIVNDKPEGNWCGTCPKCAFVYLLLASCLPKAAMYSIFQKNLFEDDALEQVYKELCGLEGIKPFECVGTPKESIEAFQMVFANPDYSNDTVVKTLKPLVYPTL